MDFKIFEAKFNKQLFIIEEDIPELGVKFLVFDENGVNTHDYYQDSVELAEGFAFRKFQVPVSNWAFKGYK